jgi:hypothetical protein
VSVVVLHSEAEKYLAELSPAVRQVARGVHDVMIGLGCASYVKTIYIGYDLEGEMVAASYGHADHVEVALALAEDEEGALLVDARHLTWRTLPVAAMLRSQNDIGTFAQLAERACARVREKSHDVNRDTDYFLRTRAERKRRVR